ncbi:MAG: glycoside hydrolase, partial [Clostridia bacterium]|nr:glycoside hydrolase [Clostridia bacterium]
MKKLTFGTPETLTPSRFCPTFCYEETPVTPREFTFRQLPSGCVLEWPLEEDTHIFGFGLQLKQFDHTGHKLTLRVNADPVSPNGESHAPVPFFVTNKGYGIYFDTARYATFTCGVKKPGGGATEGGNLPATSTEELYAVRKGGERWMSVHIPTAQGIDIY